MLQTQGGFSQDNQLVYGGHNSYKSYERVDGDGDDGDTDDDANIRDEDEGDGSNEKGVCYEGDDYNVRGVEDQDGVPSNHGSTFSPYNYDPSVKGRVLTHQ